MPLPRPVYFCGLLSMLMLGSACRPQPHAVEFSGERAFAEVRELVKISPRDAGTPGARQAAEHIQQRLAACGVQGEIDTFRDATPEGEKEFHNVVARIPDSAERWIILGSHFDTMPGIENFQGANDSGSSTGVLLELARQLMNGDELLQLLKKSKTGLLFAFFDGEEGIANYKPGDGLHGSRYMTRQLIDAHKVKKIQAMILLDMIGDRDLTFTLPRNSSHELLQQVMQAAETTGHRKRFKLTNSLIIDDHVPFMQAGIPAIDLIDFRFGSAPDLNDYWHTDADDLEHISAESLEITGTVLIQLLHQLAALNAH